jgi:hypothetical protein
VRKDLVGFADVANLGRHDDGPDRRALDLLRQPHDYVRPAIDANPPRRGPHDVSCSDRLLPFRPSFGLSLALSDAIEWAVRPLAPGQPGETMEPHGLERTMRFLRIGLVLGLLATVSACGSDDSVSTATTPSVTSVDTSEPSTTEPPLPPATTDAPTLVDVKVYFLRDERLEIAHRQVPGPAVLIGALTELLAGPTSDELAAGLHSEIPSGTTLLDLNLADELATVDLSDDYDDGGGSLSMTARIAQVVFTATQFDNSERAAFWMDGEPIEFFGGEGLVFDEPLARMNVDRAFTGGVIIDTPDPDSAVSSPFTITGEGDVFEADFPIVVRRDGVQIAGPVLGFAGGWGEWRDFEATITLDADPGPIVVVAWDEQGCTPGDPDCPPVIEVIVPLILAE